MSLYSFLKTQRYMTFRFKFQEEYVIRVFEYMYN